MKTNYKPSFLKELKTLRGTPFFEKINQVVFEEIPSLDRFEDLQNCKKILGHAIHFRIRVGDYRIGFYVENETIFFMRVGHRSQFYRTFP